jgi:hypothetical protein
MNFSTSTLEFDIRVKRLSDDVGMIESALLPFCCACEREMVLGEAGGEGACSLAPERIMVLGGICTLTISGLGTNGFNESLRNIGSCMI